MFPVAQTLVELTEAAAIGKRLPLFDAPMISEWA